MARARAENFASASLVALVVTALRETDPDLLPPGATAPDPMRDATLSAAEKRGLLEHVYARRGAGPLLAVGNRLDGAASPLLSVLANAARPEILVDKWLRLERYGHAVNRTHIDLDSDKTMSCRRWSEGAPPTAAENALIAGFLFGLCRLAGARGAALAIGGHEYDAASLATAGPLADGGGTFRIAWRDWQPPADPQAGSGAAATGERLKALFAADVARSWSLEKAARALAMSSRSLQRALSAEGLSFSTALRGVRIGEAARLLRADAASLAEIGYCCGYADQPHFQRDFRRALNMSPGEYRDFAIA